MKPKQLFLIITIAACSSTMVHAQPVSLSAKPTYNFSKMSDLKNLQSEVLSSLTGQGIPAQIVEAYPAHTGIQCGLLIPLSFNEQREISVGLSIDYASTGGRVHYADYSGELRNDQIATAFSLNGALSTRIKTLHQFDLNFSFGARMIFSSLRNEFFSRIGESSSQAVFNFTSVGVGFEPGVTPSLNLLGLTFGGSVSYLIYIPTTLEFTQYSDTYLAFNKGGRVKIDWSGLKLGVLISYTPGW